MTKESAAATPKKRPTKKPSTKKFPISVSPLKATLNNLKPRASIKNWKELVPTLKEKDDYKVRYYLSGNLHDQGDRNWVAQAAAFFNGRTKRQNCPAAAIVTAQLPLFVQGYTQNLNPNIAPIVTFRTTKHIFGFMDYIATVRNQHNNIIVYISVDDSPFLEII
jgi:hypothetical protein